MPGQRPPWNGRASGKVRKVPASKSVGLTGSGGLHQTRTGHRRADAGQNEELIRKYLEGGDTFVHADVHGASVVVVKGKTMHMDEVVRFAAAYSGAWKAGFASADVYAARPDQVSKTAESGEYLSRGSFVVRGERQWFNNVPLEVVIGLQKTPQTRILGGPGSAVRKLCDLFVVLRPGTFEPNDIAKKVVRALRERLSPADRKPSSLPEHRGSSRLCPARGI